MKIDMTGRHIDVTPALREHAEERLKKLEKLLDGQVEAHVVLFIEKHRHVAEIQVKHRDGAFSSEEETGDLYVSINEAVDKIETQIRKFKDKRADRRRREGVRAADAALTIGGQPNPAEPDRDADDDPDARRIIRTQQYRVKPLSPEDAALELESSGDDLLVFRDSQTDRLNVLRRLDDGAFALIDPEF